MVLNSEIAQLVELPSVEAHVTATAHNEIFEAKIRSRPDVAPKHNKDERPVKNRTAKGRRAPPAKNEHKRRLHRRLFHLHNTVLCPSLGD